MNFNEKRCTLLENLKDYIKKIAENNIAKLVISKPVSKNGEFIKIVAEKKDKGYQFSKYTKTQVFHENVPFDLLSEKTLLLTDGAFLQINAWDDGFEYMIMISKKGSPAFKKKAMKNPSVPAASKEHNRSKNYILEASPDILPLIDMGVFTKEGKVSSAMYDKYKQINRYIEIIDDEIGSSTQKELNIIDFGCGKSYLTFIVYYYLTYIKGIKANIIGLDLKKDVIEKCNEAAERYGYENLRFELGDINGYTAPFDVDIVMTLHACDTATDFALYNAISWNAKMIFSVPCCQHELNSQIMSDELSILTRYGIIKERFSALATDAIRANLLEYMGYKTNLLEFTDFSHTPKNILIRAVKKSHTDKSHKEKMLKEAENLIKTFNFSPTLYKLLIK